MEYKTHPCIKKHDKNPVLKASDVPYHSTLVFNPGVVKFEGRYIMVFRNDYGSEQKNKLYGRNLGLAVSDDGINWKVAEKPLLQEAKGPLSGAYDPRLIQIEGRLYMCFAFSKNGTCAGIATTEDLEKWSILSVTVPDNRNIVLFPEKIGGMFVRMERPFAAYDRPGDRFDIWISMSRDCKYWGDSELLLEASRVPWVNDKIGPGPQPVKTKRGWLAFFHGVDIDNSRKWGWTGTWNKRYSAGLLLLDIENPYKIIGISEGPVLCPETDYETKGYRDCVIFPTGLVREDDGTVKIYYGASDTVVGLATADAEELASLCREEFLP